MYNSDMEIDEEKYNIIKNSVCKKDRSNCLITYKELLSNINNGKYKIMNSNPVILLELKGDYDLLYYFIDNDHPIGIPEETLCSLNERDLIYSDITLRDEFIYERSIFQQLNMLPYRVYERKSVNNEGKHYREMLNPQYAKESDLQDIYEMLIDNFDLMADHIPDKEELLRFIQNHNITCVYLKDKIAGVLIYEDQGVKSYIRALCVKNEFQNSAVGYSLMARYFNSYIDSNVRLFYLWVDSANTSVMKLHDYFGFQADGLKNYIFRCGGKEK